MRDFRYYRCSGTDPYRFGRECICSNKQIHAETLETDIWKCVCGIVENPAILEQDGRGIARRTGLQEDISVLRTQRHKLRYGMERMIDSLAEGLIDRTNSRRAMNRTKVRIAELDTKIASQAADEDRRADVQSIMKRLAELSTHLQSRLKKADWATKRELIRAMVQRIEIGPKKIAIVLRLPADRSARTSEPIVVTLPRNVITSRTNRRCTKPTVGDRNSA